MDIITSIQNNKVKQWRKLYKRKERLKTNTFLVEGYHLVEEAKKSGWEIREIILVENKDIPTWCQHFSVFLVSESVLKHISQTETSQGILAVIEMKETPLQKNNHVLLLDAIQDPGNLGTIIRTADAAGFGAVILGEETVDVFNDKVIRATQGSLFHIPVISAKLEDMIEELKEVGFTIWASTLEKATYYDELDVPKKVALILGNEGAGIRQVLLEQADTCVKIPIYGKAESLNVGIAASILMYYIKQKQS